MQFTPLAYFITSSALCALVVATGCGGNDPGPRDGGRNTAGTGAGAGGGAGSAAGAGAGTGAGTGAGAGGAAGSGGALPDFDAGTAEDRNTVEASDLCERLSTIQCAGEAHCCTAPGRTYDECKERMKSGCVDELQLDQIAMQPNTGFDEKIASDAFAAFEALAAECDPTIALWGISLEGLRGIFQGTAAPGANCMPPLAQLQNRVVAGAAAASCAQLATHACLPEALSWTCTEKHGEGGSCFSDLNCLDGLYCDNPQGGFGAPCRVRKADGATCTNPNECQSLACKQGACTSGVLGAYCLQ
jgi:hypothetical protein